MLRHYTIQLNSELGLRVGELFLNTDKNNSIGLIDILSGKEEITCNWINEENCNILGKIKSLNKEIPFSANCILKGSEIFLDVLIRNKNIYGKGTININ